MTTSAAAARTLRLRSIFSFQPGEGHRVAIMILYSAAAIGGVLTIGQAAAGALFISQLPFTDMPFSLILPAIVIIPFLYAYNRLSQHLRLDPQSYQHGIQRVAAATDNQIEAEAFAFERARQAQCCRAFHAAQSDDSGDFVVVGYGVVGRHCIGALAMTVEVMNSFSTHRPHLEKLSRCW